MRLPLLKPQWLWLERTVSDQWSALRAQYHRLVPYPARVILKIFVVFFVLAPLFFHGMTIIRDMIVR